MGLNLNNYMWGVGKAFAGGKPLPEMQEIGINIGMEVLSATKGDGGGKITEPTSQPITGRINFLGMNSAIFALLTGGAVSTGSVKRVRNTQKTVSSNAISLSNTPILNTLEIVENGSSKVPLKRVASPAANDEYSISGTTVTFNTGAFADDTVILVSYFYDDTSNGETVKIDPGDLPDSFEVYASVRTREGYAGTLGDVVIYAAKCTRTSEFNMGASNSDIAQPGFDFEVRIDTADDFKVTFP